MTITLTKREIAETLQALKDALNGHLNNIDKQIITSLIENLETNLNNNQIKT